MLKLKSEIKFFLEDEEEINLQVSNLYLVKNKISESCIVLLASLNTPNCFDYRFSNQILYDVDKKEILYVFLNVFSSLFNETEEKIEKFKISCEKLYAKLQVAIKKEFDSILSEITLEKELLSDEIVVEMAKDALENGHQLEYQIPFLKSNEIFFTYSFLEEVQKDINDAAYNLMEKYLMKNPAYLRECQRIFAARVIYNKRIGMLSEEEKEKKEILNILQSSDYKSLRIKTRKTDGGFLEDSYKTENINVASFPYWIIEEISYNRKTLYKCNIKDIYKWEHNKTEIINKISAMTFSELQKNRHFFVTWFPKDMLDDEELMLLILNKNLNVFLELKDISEFDLEFFEKLSKKEEMYQLNALCYRVLPETSLLKDKDSVLALLSYGYSNIINYLPKEILYDTDILKICLEKNLSLDFSKVFTPKGVSGVIPETEQKVLIKFMDDLANKENFDLNINIKNEDFIEDILTNYEFAKKQCIYSEKFFNFKHIVVDEDFILDVLKRSVIIVYTRRTTYVNWGFYNSLPTSFKRNKIIAKEFINLGLNRGLKDKDFYDKFWFSFDSFDEILNVIKNGNPNHFLINFLKESEQLKVIEAYPEILHSVFLDTESSLYNSLMTAKYDFLIEIAIKHPAQFPWSRLNEKQALEILQKDFSMVKFMPDYLINNQDTVNYLADKIWILDRIRERDLYYCKYKIHPLDDKAFLRKQAKFNSSDILCYIPKSTKKLNPYSLQDDKDFVLELINLNSKNIYGLDKNSKFFRDLDFAKAVLPKEPETYTFFGKRVLSNKVLKEYLKIKLSEEKFNMIYS